MNDENDNVKCWVSSIGNFLVGHGGEYNSDNPPLIIPPYQRPYAWQEKHVNRLCTDIFKAISEGVASYHLGTLIFHSDEQGGGRRWAVVDGQQRLRTIGKILRKQIVQEGENKLSPEDACMISRVLGRYVERNEELCAFLKKCTVVCILVEDIAEAFQLFDTQNGRGKELSPVNLLKAYHFHEMNRPGDIGHAIPDKRIQEVERRWEASNGMKANGGTRLLQHVFAEHLFRLRRWCRGQFDAQSFSKDEIDEFKGLTIASSEDSLPLQNAAILRRLFREHYTAFGFSLDGVAGRLGQHKKDPRNMDPFAMVSQPIVNGEDFFNYAETYATIYRELFPVTEDRGGQRNVLVSFQDAELADFRCFHKQYCLYGKHGRSGDTYARHVFESLCVFCFDRFGAKGLNAIYKHLYRFAFYERVTQSYLRYQKAGATFALECIRGMQKSETMSELDNEIQKLLEQLRSLCDEYVDACSKDRLPFCVNGNSSDISTMVWELVLGADNRKRLMSIQNPEAEK